MTYKPCRFKRKDYLQYGITFDEVMLTEVDGELSEFNDDVEDMAYELAYSRYLIACYEKSIEAARCVVMSSGGTVELDELKAELLKIPNWADND